MSSPRTHLGVVIVTVHDDDAVHHTLDAAEAGVGLWSDEERVTEFGAAQVEAGVTCVDVSHGRCVPSRVSS